jgi:hypothetical protein
MNKTQRQQDALKRQLQAAEAKVSVGATYTHYKGADKIYEVTGLGFLEATDELYVIYKALYDDQLTFLRPVSMWLEEIEWNGEIVARFAKI